MSGVLIMRYLLTNNANLIAAVPASRIMAGVVPINTPFPAISITQVTGSQKNFVNAPGNFQKERIQVTVETKLYPQAKEIISLIRNAFPGYSRGSVNGFNCDSVFPDVVGPDLEDTETGIFSQSHDFIVRWNS